MRVLWAAITIGLMGTFVAGCGEAESADRASVGARIEALMEDQVVKSYAAAGIQVTASLTECRDPNGADIARVKDAELFDADGGFQCPMTIRLPESDRCTIQWAIVVKPGGSWRSAFIGDLLQDVDCTDGDGNAEPLILSRQGRFTAEGEVKMAAPPAASSEENETTTAPSDATETEPPDSQEESNDVDDVPGEVIPDNGNDPDNPGDCGTANAKVNGQQVEVRVTGSGGPCGEIIERAVTYLESGRLPSGWSSDVNCGASRASCAKGTESFSADPVAP